MEIVIERTKSWFRIPWKEIWEYRDLLYLLVRRDFVARYKQTILGPAWFVFQPLLTTLVFTVIFGKVMKIPTDSIPPVLFYLCGMLAWSYFAQCLNATGMSLLNNVHIFSKVYFPRLVVPFSIVISNLASFAIQAATFAVFWAAFKLWGGAAADHFGIRLRLAAFAPLVLVQTAALGLGAGLWMSALTARYRDIVHLAGFMTQLWMYATPVVYPLSVVPEKWRWVAAANPMTFTVEYCRAAFLGAGTLSAQLALVSALVTIVLLAAGLGIFNHVEKTYVDTV